MTAWLSARSFGEILCLLVVTGAILVSTIGALRGKKVVEIKLKSDKE